MSDLENRVSQTTNLPTDVFKAAVVMSLSDPSVRIVPLSMAEASAEFDRWLNEVKAQAWQEGWGTKPSYQEINNPYRKGD